MKRGLLSIFAVLWLLANGCASRSVAPTKSVSAADSFHLVLARYPDSVLFKLSVLVDGQEVRLKSGSFLELNLPPGTHSISGSHGHFLGRNFPLATADVSGSAGERKYFRYVMKFQTQHNFYPLGMGINGDMPSARPYEAAWKEIEQTDFESTFPGPKFYN